MEGKGLLDPLDDLRVFALYHVSWAETLEKLDIWSKSWSQRRMGTTKSSSIRLWVSGRLPNLMGNEFRSYLIPNYGVEGIIDEGGDDGSSMPIFDGLSFK